MNVRACSILLVALGLTACGSSSSGGNQAPTVTAESPCLGGRTWRMRSASNSNVQNTGTWEFRTDGRYRWQQTSPVATSGDGTWEYANGVLTVTGFLKNAFARTGLIPLTFDNNRMSFTTDTGAVFTFDPPDACTLVMRTETAVQAGAWQFDAIPDGATESEPLLEGLLHQEGALLRLEGEHQVVGELVDGETWDVQVGPDLHIRGQFAHYPATRFRGTYVRGEETGQVFGYVSSSLNR